MFYLYSQNDSNNNIINEINENDKNGLDYKKEESKEKKENKEKNEIQNGKIDIHSLTVDELKNELKKRKVNIPKNAKKKDLQELLINIDKKPVKHNQEPK